MQLSEGERGVSLVAAVIVFATFLALAIFSVFVAENVPGWVRLVLVSLACFSGWLLFLAPAKVRVAVMERFPWF